MKAQNAIRVINIMKKWAKDKKISLLLAGSVGYRSALKNNSELEKCDDIDCIFIYDNLAQISDSPFYDEAFYTVVCKALPQKADMFSTKLVINEVKISADFISTSYLRNLAEENIVGTSKYRYKLTNAIEVPENVYCNFYGKRTCYNKTWEEYENYRIYKLPIHLFVDGSFFQGALLSKFVFNPTEILLKEQHEEYIRKIQEKVKNYCPNDGSLCNAYYKCDNFSDETKKFLKNKAMKDKKTILVTGNNGFIGNYFVKKYRNQYNIIGLDITPPVEKKLCTIQYIGDICDKELIAEIFHKNKIDVVVHTAAEKSLIICENNKEKAYNVNYKATINLASISEKNEAKFIFISSDQVFDGKSSYSMESTVVNPINYYGKLKVMAENELLRMKNAAICRTALVFGEIPDEQKEYFDEIKTSEDLVVQGFIVQHVRNCLENNLKIVLPNDEFVSPTHAILLAEQINKVIERDISGILHCCGNDRISRYDMGLAIAEYYGLPCEFIQSKGKNNPLRPKDVSLDCSNSEKKLQMKFPDFKTMLYRYM